MVVNRAAIMIFMDENHYHSSLERVICAINYKNHTSLEPFRKFLISSLFKLIIYQI